MTVRHPVLIVEGQGDEAAVPRFLRDYMHSKQIFDFNPMPRPLKNVEIRKLQREGELERFIKYAAMQEGDSIFLILDCEDFDPDKIIQKFNDRIIRMSIAKPVHTFLFKSEFESLFIPCLPRIAEIFPDYKWRPRQLEITGDCERFRNAKGCISDAMQELAYKETRDQAKFLSGIDYEILRERSASFRRFETEIQRATGVA